MPTEPKRRKREALEKKDAERKKKQKAEEEADDEESAEDTEDDDEEDSEEEDAASEEGEPAATQKLEWFSLEGCEPVPGDAPGVADLLQHCQLPPWAPAGAATALANRLTATPEGRRFASVVKQCLPDSDEDDGGAASDAEDAEGGVFSVLGIADAAVAPGLRECLGNAAPSAPLQLLVKARAQELPPELSLPQLEALQEELAKAKSPPRQLLLISPTWPVGEGGNGDSGAEAAVFAEDDILQAAAGLGDWTALQPPAGYGGKDEDRGESWRYRACLLESSRLPRAIERLKREVGGKLRPA